MISQRQAVKKLYTELCKQTLQPFPQSYEPLDAPIEHGVYVIRKGKKILHVGRTHRAKYGIYQRLKNHLHGQSTFVEVWLDGNGDALRKGYTYQYLVVRVPKMRAFLEHYAIGTLCPEHIGLGE